MGPLSWSAIAAGSAALAESLGLNVAATGLIVGNRNKNIEEFKNWARTQYPMPETKVIIPSAENALVLRPEYRTVTTPVEYIGYKPLLNNADTVVIEAEDTSSAQGNVREHNNPSSPKPEDEKPKEDKGFKKGLKKGLEHIKKVGSTIGTGLGYGIGFGIPAAATIGAGYGLYKLFNSDKKDELKDSDIREIE